MKKILLLYFIFLSLPCMLYAQLDFNGVVEALKTARPGDTLVLADGNYRDIEINLVKKGDASKPIVIKARTPGSVVISGNSFLRIAGTGIEVNGFHFTNGYAPKGSVIEFRSGTEVAEYCRITQCAIDNFNPPSRDSENSWILLYGRNNRFDHNSIQGKLNNGVTLAVILDEYRNIKNYHLIDHNYFGERVNLGSNGGETIRVGTSQSSNLSSFTRLENNFFEHCDGEVEIVSIKSCDNMIRNNTFHESAGVLALRHGHRNLVEGNAFIGNGKPYTGGIRVINEGHIIRNNYFKGLKGNRFFAALAIMNAVPNSLPNRYHQVKDVSIEKNVWMDCDNIEFCVGKDHERTLAPANVRMEGNVFFNKNRDKVYKTYDDITGFRFINNVVATRTGKFVQKGFSETKTPPLNPAKNAVEKADCGAYWYVPQKKIPRILSGKTISVPPGQNTLVKAVESAAAGDVIELSNQGDYLLDRTLEIKTYLRITGSNKLKTRPVIQYNGSKGKTAIFTIMDGGILELASIDFDNAAREGKTASAATIMPAAAMMGHYSVFVDHCGFYNFQESSYSPFKAQRTTYADSLIFTNCLFRDMSGDAISLAAEKDDAGKYSAEYVAIKNCVFYKVLGYAVDLYRGGSDESTTGPSILVDHCVLEDVNNKERGAGMRLYGVQNVTVMNTVFSNTGRGGASIRFDEASWDKIAVTNCSLYNSGRISSFWGKVVTGPMFNLKPVYRYVPGYDFRLEPESLLLKKGMGGIAIGLSNN